MCPSGVCSLGRSQRDTLGRGAETEQGSRRSYSCVSVLPLAPSSFGDLGQVDFDLLIRAAVFSSVTWEYCLTYRAV